MQEGASSPRLSSFLLAGWTFVRPNPTPLSSKLRVLPVISSSCRRHGPTCGHLNAVRYRSCSYFLLSPSRVRRQYNLRQQPVRLVHKRSRRDSLYVTFLPPSDLRCNNAWFVFTGDTYQRLRGMCNPDCESHPSPQLEA